MKLKFNENRFTLLNLRPRSTKSNIPFGKKKLSRFVVILFKTFWVTLIPVNDVRAKLKVHTEVYLYACQTYDSTFCEND